MRLFCTFLYWRMPFILINNLILLAFFGTGSCLIITGFISCDDREYAVACLALAVGFSGLVRAGHIVNHVDFAPK